MQIRVCFEDIYKQLWQSPRTLMGVAGSGFGGTGAQMESDNAEESRQESGGYGPGSGVGA